MFQRGYSPDNARAEGLFRRLRVDFFYGCDWMDVTMKRFMELLDEYLVCTRTRESRAAWDTGPHAVPQGPGTGSVGIRSKIPTTVPRPAHRPRSSSRARQS